MDSGAHLGRQIWEQHGSAHAKFKKGREGKLKAKGIIQWWLNTAKLLKLFAFHRWSGLVQYKEFENMICEEVTGALFTVFCPSKSPASGVSLRILGRLAHMQVSYS